MPEPRASDDPESALIKRVADGDREAFRDLYALYHKRLFAYLTKLLSARETVEEVLQDVMFEVWRQAGRFRGEAKVATWIFGIAHHKALNVRRAQGNRVMVQLEEANATQTDAVGPQALAEKSDLGKKVRAALAWLSEDHRAVVELTFYHGFSYAEIAHIVNCPVNTVKTRMFHARRQLRELLSKMGLS